VAVTLVWSAGVTDGLLNLVNIFVPPRVSREPNSKASTFRNTARRFSEHTGLGLLPFG
jgi:hypothetical protein